MIEKIDLFNKQSVLINDFETQQCKKLALTITQPVELPEICQKIICGLNAYIIGRTLRKFNFLPDKMKYCRFLC